MAITAAMVKELRERTGAGMMECKKALAAADGDMERAIEEMRKKGSAKADKKAGRTAAEGKIVIAFSDDAKQAAMVEINSETDFVAKDSNFIAFANTVADTALSAAPADVAALSASTLASGQTVEEARKALVAKIGENIQVRRFQYISSDAPLASYQHGDLIGVVVAFNADVDAELGKGIAMHIAASRPICVDESGVPAEKIAKEKEIFTAQAIESGKPANIAEKMVVGRMKKFLAEITLVGQPFVKDPDQTVGKLLKSAGVSVTEFACLKVGEGIEKKQEDFASEVMAQVKAS
ncbi:MAG: translation elongation factor Ts [bacterium]